MIAPTNCCPDCDCAQRMVRCQRAAPVGEYSPLSEKQKQKAREAAIRKDWEEHQDYDMEGVLPETPPMVIPASLAQNPPATAIDVLTNEPVATDIVIGGDGKVYRADYSEIEQPVEPGIVATAPNGPQFQTITLDELLTELEKEFPATMGIAHREPVEAALTAELTNENGEVIGTLTSQHVGAWGPHCVIVYDRTDLRIRLIKAFRDCQLDCGAWSDNALNELADIAIKTLEAKT